jgi:hypothetical protein
MSNQAAAVLISILFAVGTAGISYAADARATDTGELQGSDAHHMREGANVALFGSGIPPGFLRNQLLLIDGENDETKDLTEQEVRFQHNEQTLMNTHPVLAIRSATTGSVMTIPARSISPVLRLKRNSREE